MTSAHNSARITGKVQGRDITLEGPLSKDEIRDSVWWWQVATPRTAKERDCGHTYDGSQHDAIATLGGYYQVPGDPGTPEADALVDMVYAELNPDE